MTEVGPSRGRPYGGKCWLINKNLRISNYNFINNDISYVEISDSKSISKLIVIGLHLPFDDNSTEKLANYISNLQILESIIEEHVDIPLFIVGDFNTDLNLDKRYTKQLKKLMQECSLASVDYEFPNIDYTYQNGNYRNHIDHVLANEVARNITIDCKIIENMLNMSDHNPINTSFLLDIESTNLNIPVKNFYRFPWKDEEFLADFQKHFDDKIKIFDYNVPNELTMSDKTVLIESKLNELKSILLSAARKADKNSQKRKNIINYNKKQYQRTWTPELANISEQLRYWFRKWLLSNKNDTEANKNYKFYKKRFRSI